MKYPQTILSNWMKYHYCYTKSLLFCLIKPQIKFSRVDFPIPLSPLKKLFLLFPF